MTQATFPDLVRPTRWQASVQQWHGQPVTIEIKDEHQYPEDALEAFRATSGKSPEQVTRLEFLNLTTQAWVQISDVNLQAAIVLAKEGAAC